MISPYVASLRAHIGSQCILLPGVRAILVNDRGEVLLQRRTDMGRWGLPAGSVELEESALEALKREVSEETGLRVLHAEPMGLYSGHAQRLRYPNGDQIQCFAVAFIVREWEGEPRADGVEGSAVRFWPLDALPPDLVQIHARTLDDFRRYRGVFVLDDAEEQAD